MVLNIHFSVTLLCAVVLRQKKKPTDVVCPEKLPFKERLAFYQTMLDTGAKEEEKKFNRRSWAPGTTHPLMSIHTGTSGSATTSPLLSRHPRSSSYLRSKPMLYYA